MHAALLLHTLPPASAALHLAHVIRTYPDVAPSAFECAVVYWRLSPQKEFARVFQIEMESVWLSYHHLPNASRLVAETGMHRLAVALIEAGPKPSSAKKREGGRWWT